MTHAQAYINSFEFVERSVVLSEFADLMYCHFDFPTGSSLAASNYVLNVKMEQERNHIMKNVSGPLIILAIFFIENLHLEFVLIIYMQFVPQHLLKKENRKNKKTDCKQWTFHTIFCILFLLSHAGCRYT